MRIVFNINAVGPKRAAPVPFLCGKLRLGKLSGPRPELLNLHAHKTGALIIAAVELGCAAAGVRPDTDTRKALVRYAAELGLVFQIVDDILDVTSTTEELGKPVGSDADNDKTTFITLYGLQGAHEEAERHNAAALAALDALGPGADFLRLMAAELLERKK